MANIIQNCNICNKRVKIHEKTVTCKLCTIPSHHHYLPIYSPEDIAYASNPNHHWTCPTCLTNIFPFHLIDIDQDFHQQINSQHQPIFNFETLDQMLFHSFELNNLDIDDDLDPDKKFYNPHNNNHPTSCKYYHPDQLNKVTNSNAQNHFSNLTFNIRSLPKNYRQLNILLDILDIQFHTISLTETWLKEHNKDLYEIEGYTHEPQLREGKDGGGVSIYVKNNINYKIRSDLNVTSHDYQFLWLELDKSDTNTEKNIIIGVIYRRPGSDIPTFNEKLSDTLAII
jgi:hypothetical protein